MQNNDVVQNSHLMLIQDNRFCAWLLSVVGVVVLGFIHLSHVVKPIYRNEN